MNNDEIIRMAREAGFIPNGQAERAWLERFAALVAAHEREKLKSTYEQMKFDARVEALAEQAEQEPIGMVIGGVFEPCNDDVLSGTWELYAAPVRTKDLTDVDLWKLWENSGSNIDFARAVIAADREKNK